MSHSLFKKKTNKKHVLCFYFEKIGDLKKQATLTSLISCTQIKQYVCVIAGMFWHLEKGKLNH